MKKLLLLFLIFQMHFSYAQNSLNMNLLGTYDFSNSEGSDIWGWADGNNNEYALACLNDGFSVVDVTIPSNPLLKFHI